MSKLCKECGQPVLKRGQKRKHPNDYQHAIGCPNDDSASLTRRINGELTRRNKKGKP